MRSARIIKQRAERCTPGPPTISARRMHALASPQSVGWQLCERAGNGKSLLSRCRLSRALYHTWPTGDSLSAVAGNGCANARHRTYKAVRECIRCCAGKSRQTPECYSCSLDFSRLKIAAWLWECREWYPICFHIQYK
jgi:hypothetical protein